jgi:undecaprenyl-diphosphatase
LDVIEALVLGILQGATEFLPISSSGHLVLVPWWLGWDEPPLVFDIMVHLGTLVAVLVYFRRDWLNFLRAGMATLRHRSIEDPDTRLLLWLVLGTLPAAVIGFVFEDVFRAAFLHPPLVAALLLVTALLLFISERRGANVSQRTLNDLTARDALTIGLAQAVAIFPGISRSGSTIAFGLFRGLPRPDAAQFSFLLAPPIIGGAGIKELLDASLAGIGTEMVFPLLIGFITSMVVGYGCIWFLMRLLQRRRLYGFAMYCATFGTLSLLVALFA